VLNDVFLGGWQVFRRDLAALRNAGCRYVLLGIEEDLGARANFGRGGSAGAWAAFLPMFCSMQDNGSLRGSAIAVLGSVAVPTDGAATSAGGSDEVLRLRRLVAELDVRVQAVAEEVLKCGGLELIAVGGGHNNCLPLLRAACAAAGGRAVSAVNLDPHSDLRNAAEGRHSGNGFSTALEEGSLGRYYLCGFP
jgi:formiminoglutamase